MKPCLVVLAVSFALMVLGAVVGGFLESSGTVTRATLGSKGVALVRLSYLGLFLVAGFALVPVALRMFLALQDRIGNSGLFVIKWLRLNEQTVVYCFWGIMVFGLILAFGLARDEILRQFK